LSGPQCDVVTGQEEGNARLEALERGNFFVVPLDDKRQWYRYHHLFAEVLFAHLMQEQPAQIPTLHRRASEWYQHNGLAADAIRHALAAAISLARRISSSWQCQRCAGVDRKPRCLAGSRRYPDELVHCRPVLSVAYAGALLQGGELEDVEARLRDAERWLDTTADMRERPDAPSAEMVVMHEEEFRRLPASIAMYRAGHALARGDAARTVTYARRVLDLVPEDDHFSAERQRRSWGSQPGRAGISRQAHRSYAEAWRFAEGRQHLRRGRGRNDFGRYTDRARSPARRRCATYEHALRLATEQGDPADAGNG
jgi:LuxR family maltose regulon positive regulatory protein